MQIGYLRTNKSWFTCPVPSKCIFYVNTGHTKERNANRMS